MKHTQPKNSRKGSLHRRGRSAPNTHAGDLLEECRQQCRLADQRDAVDVELGAFMDQPLDELLRLAGAEERESDVPAQRQPSAGHKAARLSRQPRAGNEQ
jgi:hypothetical protein